MLLDTSISELAAGLKKKKFSSVDLVREAYDRIERLDGQLGAFIAVKNKADALREAEDRDRERPSDASPLYGIPYSVKDVFCTRDLPTTAGSKVLEGFMSPYDATVVQKLKEIGAILIGKNSLDAWGHGGANENTDYAKAHNPWDPARIAGGSSGGPAAAVAARLVPFAIGEDTGGSIRNPASMCGVTGLKVTYGRVSRYGAIAYASSLDTVGPMAKSVADCAFILQAIAGRDLHDGTTSARPVDQYEAFVERGVKGMSIGFPTAFLRGDVATEVRETLERAAQKLNELGASIIEIDFSIIKHAVSAYYLVAMSETSSNLARYDGVRFGHGRECFTAETRRRICLGTYALSAGYADEFYKRAQKARTLFVQEFERVFEHCDSLLMPVTPHPASKAGEFADDPLKEYLEDLFTVPASLAGHPSLALPGGFTGGGLPVGMQIIGRKFHEGELFQIGHAFQSVTKWHEFTPPVS